MPKRRRRMDVEHLAAAHRAAKAAGASAGAWWKSLSDAAESTTTATSLETLLRDAMVTMTDALQVDTVAFLLANEEGTQLVARVATGLREETAFDLGIRAGQGMAGWVLANRRPLIVADLSKIAVVSPVLRNSGVRSVAAVPVLSDGHPLGVLYAASYELNRFDTSDTGMLELLADLLAAAIERVRSFETERQARAMAEQLADRLARIQAVTAGLAAAGTVGEVATAVAESLVAGEADALASALWVLHEDTLEIAGSAAQGLGVPHFEPIGLDEERAVARAARLAKPLYFDHPEEIRAEFPFSAEAYPEASVALAPIVLRGVCLGVLVASYRSEGHGSDEREFLEAVADHVAQALERARLAGLHEQLAEMNAYFARAAKVLAEGNDLTDTLERLASVALLSLGDICLIDVASEPAGPAGLTRMVARHRDPARQHLVDRLKRDFAPEADGPHPAALVIRTGVTHWVADMSEQFLAETTRNEDHLALTKALGFRSYISVPLRTGPETLGSLTLVSTGRHFGPEDVAFAEQLSEQVAPVVHKVRRYDIAVATSHILQSALLPARLPAVEGLAIHTRYVAASEGLEVGGDFYDVIALEGTSVAFMIGDVAGHDRDAAALMGQLRSAARALAGRVGSPAALISALQEMWHRLDFDRFATGVFGELDAATGDLVLASAGHYPPLLVEGGGTRYLPVTPSPPLGVLGGVAQEWRGRLAAGSALLLYTDGLIDERTSGPERALDELARAAASTPAAPSVTLGALCDRVVGLLPAARADDVALLALRRERTA